MKKTIRLLSLLLVLVMLTTALTACGEKNIPTEDDFIQVLTDLGYTDQIIEVSDEEHGLIKARGLLLYGTEESEVMPLYAMYIRYSDKDTAASAEAKLKENSEGSEYIKIKRDNNIVFAIIANGDGVETAKRIWDNIK